MNTIRLTQLLEKAFRADPEQLHGGRVWRLKRPRPLAPVLEKTLDGGEERDLYGGTLEAKSPDLLAFDGSDGGGGNRTRERFPRRLKNAERISLNGAARPSRRLPTRAQPARGPVAGSAHASAATVSAWRSRAGDDGC